MDRYYKSKEFKAILAKYENADKPNAVLSTDEYADIAQYYHEAGDDDKALQAARTAVEIYPGSVAPLSFLARYEILENRNSKKQTKSPNKFPTRMILTIIYLSPK